MSSQEYFLLVAAAVVVLIGLWLPVFKLAAWEAECSAAHVRYSTGMELPGTKGTLKDCLDDGWHP